MNGKCSAIRILRKLKSIKSMHRKLTKRMTDKALNDRKIKIAKRKQARKEVR